MALTLTSSTNFQFGGPGNFSSISQYYWVDIERVENQVPGTKLISEQVNIIFRGENITALGAKYNNAWLPMLALPCPPYYHEDRIEATPGNIIM